MCFDNVLIYNNDVFILIESDQTNRDLSDSNRIKYRIVSWVIRSCPSTSMLPGYPAIIKCLAQEQKSH